MTELIPYDMARTALSEAKTFDDVKEIINRAEAMAVYYKRANDKTLEADAIEIRMFAQRRYGQMLASQKAQGLLSRGRAGKGRPRLNDPLGGSDDEPPKDAAAVDALPTLADLGISKQFSARAQKMAAMPPAVFEAKVASWRSEALVSDRVTTNLLEVGREEEQRESRRNIAQALSDTSHELNGERSFSCVYLDPAYARKAGIGDRAYENHYRTEKWDGILDIMKKVAPALQPNAWAFIWIPRAHMLALHGVKYKIAIDDGSIHEVPIKIPLIWAIARALGMDEYSTCFVWTKTDEDHPDEHGTFLIARDQDEILCLYKKGTGLPRPPPENIYGSNHRERSRPLGHSRKPQFYREMIAAMTGGLPVLELFARADADHPLPPNWEAWGNESTPEIQNSDGSVEGHAPEGTVPVAASGLRERRPRDVEAAGSQREAETGRSPETARVMEQASDRTSQNSDRIAGPAAARGRADVELGPSETYDEVILARALALKTNNLLDDIPFVASDSEHLRWESEGGRIPPDDDPVIVKPLRTIRVYNDHEAIRDTNILSASDWKSRE